jgi:hypothetical protein
MRFQIQKEVLSPPNGVSFVDLFSSIALRIMDV